MKKINQIANSPSKQLRSDAWKRGRRLKLEFAGDEVPLLESIQFLPKQDAGGKLWQKNHPEKEFDFQWTEVPQALSLLFLDYVLWDVMGQKGQFYFTGKTRGSLAASLGDAITKDHGRIHELFTGADSSGMVASPAKLVFGGINVHGKTNSKTDRLITVKLNYLPPDCVQISWNGRQITSPSRIENLANRIRNSLGLPIAADILARQASHCEPPSAASSEHLATPPPLSVHAPTTHVPVSKQFPELDMHRKTIISFLEGGCSSFEIWAMLKEALGVMSEEQIVANYIEALLRELFPLNKINPTLFKAKDGWQAWENETPILEFPYGNDTDSWTIRDACNGTLILGVSGSGKTTGSGRTIAGHLLTRGFGGLILTTNAQEVSDWVKLASMCGRGKDAAVVSPKGFLRLNIIHYVMERLAGEMDLSDQLVAFLKNLIGTIGDHNYASTNESGFEAIQVESLQKAVACFLLGRFPITLRNLCSFIAEAPTNAAEAEGGKWKREPVFGACMLQADQSAKSREDVISCRSLFAYWLNTFPNLASEARSQIIAGVLAIIRALDTDHINSLLSAATTITPESIFDGRIIILNLPTDDHHTSGLIVQTAWKYLFQKAALKRADKALGFRCRPAFLWEDQCQHFLIDHDADFLPLAHEQRVASVRLTQNIGAFHTRFAGGNKSSKIGFILENLKTRILHTNSDPATNIWASQLIATELNALVADEIKKRNLKMSAKEVSKLQIDCSLLSKGFAKLQKGCVENGFVTEVLFSQAGRLFAGGTNFTLVGFRQTLLPVLPEEELLKMNDEQKLSSGIKLTDRKLPPDFDRPKFLN